MILPVAGEVSKDGKGGVVIACEKHAVVSAPLAGRVKHYPSRDRVLVVGDSATVRLTGVKAAVGTGVLVPQGMTLGTSTGEELEMVVTEVNPLVFVGLP